MYRAGKMTPGTDEWEELDVQLMNKALRKDLIHTVEVWRLTREYTRTFDEVYDAYSNKREHATRMFKGLPFDSTEGMILFRCGTLQGVIPKRGIVACNFLYRKRSDGHNWRPRKDMGDDKEYGDELVFTGTVFLTYVHSCLANLAAVWWNGTPYDAAMKDHKKEVTVTTPDKMTSRTHRQGSMSHHGTVSDCRFDLDVWTMTREKRRRQVEYEEECVKVILEMPQFGGIAKDLVYEL